MPRLINIERLRKFIQENAGKMTAEEMSIHLDVGKTTVDTHARQMDIIISSPKDKEKFNRIAEAVTIHHKEKTVRQIADMMGVSTGMIQYHGLMQKIEFKPFARGKNKVKQESKTGYFEHSKDTWRI